MIIFILLCFITGAFIINLICKNINLSKLLILSLPIGVVFHTIVFLLLSFGKIYYNKYLFILISLLSVLSLLKNRVKIKNDLKDFPIYYIIFVLYIIYRLLLMSNTGFFEFYNFDEFTAYQTGSTITYLSHNFSEIYQPYAPINYFLGTMSLEFVGLSVTAARSFSAIFFGLISLFIFKALRENHVNKHISSLLAMLFLISSSEILQLAKGFYTNIFFMAYFTMGIYGLIYHYFVKKQKGIPYVYFILIIGAFLTRREVMYFIVVILLMLSIVVFIKKLINKKQLIMMNLPLLFPFIWKFMENCYNLNVSVTNSEETVSVIDRLTASNLQSFISNIYNQTFELDYYYFNVLIFVVFLITISVILFKLLRKKSRDDIAYFSGIVILIEFMYIAIVLITEILIFTMDEYLQAASFARYIVPVLEINFILLGCLLFKNTD